MIMTMNQAKKWKNLKKKLLLNYVLIDCVFDGISISPSAMSLFWKKSTRKQLEFFIF